MEEKALQKILAAAIFTFAFFFMTPHLVQAATLYFAPASGTYKADGAFSVSVYVSSAERPMNAVQGDISFPADKLEVTSLSKGSVINLWVQEPVFSNSAGSVNFEGIVLNPGFTGASGKIITINFKAKSSGTATLVFSSGSVLANDGKGTNILISLGSAQFTLGAPEPTTPPAASPAEPEASAPEAPAPAAPEAAPAATTAAPAAPRISSATHPDSDKWYAARDARFTWPVSSDITGARLLVGKLPRSSPTVVYAPAISYRELPDLEDGVWYFHVQLRNASGWGGISHFKFQIDSAKPNAFEITEIARTTPTDPKARFIFSAQDAVSGIDYYEIQIDSESAEIWRDDGSHRYVTPAMGPGQHTLMAKAVDQAGNSLVDSVEFTVELLNPPTIEDCLSELPSGEPLVISGSTYAKSQVTLWIQRTGDDPQSFSVESDRNGKFVFSTDEGMKQGIYKIWAEATNVQGAKSLPTAKITLAVKSSVAATSQPAATWIASPYAATAAWIALILMSVVFVWRENRRFSLSRKKSRKDMRGGGETYFIRPLRCSKMKCASKSRCWKKSELSLSGPMKRKKSSGGYNKM